MSRNGGAAPSERKLKQGFGTLETASFDLVAVMAPARLRGSETYCDDKLPGPNREVSLLYNSFNINDLRLAAPPRLITRLLSTTYIIFLFWVIFLNKKSVFLKKEVALPQIYRILPHEQKSAS